MPWRARTTDRRGAARFEIVGRLSGSLLVTEALRICNISRGGALLQSSRPLGGGTLHTIQLEFDASVATVHARVVRVDRSTAANEYTVALEFVDLTPSALETIERLTQSGEGASVC
jgi:hypothetical protein